MKHQSILIAVLATLVTGALHAAQPKLKNAQENLHAALRHVLNSANEKTKSHLEHARTSLELAKTNLDGAAKNKGSHTSVAIEKIDAAIKEV